MQQQVAQEIHFPEHLTINVVLNNITPQTILPMKRQWLDDAQCAAERMVRLHLPCTLTLGLSSQGSHRMLLVPELDDLFLGDGHLRTTTLLVAQAALFRFLLLC